MNLQRKEHCFMALHMIGTNMIHLWSATQFTRFQIEIICPTNQAATEQILVMGSHQSEHREGLLAEVLEELAVLLLDLLAEL